MELVDNIRTVLRRKRLRYWRANNYAQLIKEGKIRLSDLIRLSMEAQCSLTYLASGGKYEYLEDLSPRIAIEQSVAHGGYDKNDFARLFGFRDFSAVAKQIDSGSIKVITLIAMAEKLNISVWEMLCDRMYMATDDIFLEPNRTNKIRELNTMGWL